MAVNALTLSDVYQPLSAKDILQAAAMRNEMENAKVRNRIDVMKMEDMGQQRKTQQDYQNYYMRYYGGGQGGPGGDVGVNALEVQPDTGMQTQPQPQQQQPNFSMDNNLGNIRSGVNGFRKYDTPEAGVSDAAGLLRRAYRGMTLEQIGNKWAPPSENNTPAWVGNVSKTSGLDSKTIPDLDDPATLTKLLSGIAVAEKSKRVLSRFNPEIIQRGVANALGGSGNVMYADASGPKQSMTDAGQRGMRPPQTMGEIQARLEMDKVQELRDKTELAQIGGDIDTAVQGFSMRGDNAGFQRFVNNISAQFPNNKLLQSKVNVLKNVDVSGGKGEFKFEGIIDDETRRMADRYLRNSPDLAVQQFLKAKKEGTPVKVDTKDGVIVGISPSTAVGKSRSKEQIIHQSLVEQLGREPTAQEELKAITEREIEVAGTKKNPNKLDIWLKAEAAKLGRPLNAEERKQIQMKNELYEKTGIEDPNDIKSLMAAVADGTLSISDLSKRSAFHTKLISELKKEYPNLDLARAVEMHRYKGTEAFHKAQTALEAIPVALEEVTTRGMGLNFPKLKKAAEINAWADENLGDPRFTGYLTARNDAIQNLAQAFRGGVATDMAQKLEERAVPIPLNPKALYEWYKVQMKLVDSRLKSYGLDTPKIKSFEELSGKKSSPDSKTEWDKFWK